MDSENLQWESLKGYQRAEERGPCFLPALEQSLYPSKCSALEGQLLLLPPFPSLSHLGLEMKKLSSGVSLHVINVSNSLVRLLKQLSLTLFPEEVSLIHLS